VSDSDYTLRRYENADEDAAIELWRRTWQAAYPHIDFSARVSWWRKRWREELVPLASISVGLAGRELAGLVTIEPASGYLDQIVVAPEHWGGSLAAVLLDEAKRISPAQLELLVNKDNARAIRFYEKHGFRHAGEDVNPVSGLPVNRMRWQP
jgi:putative acetyltransferase